MNNRKSLSINEATYNRLRKLGKFGESFDELLNRLMDGKNSIKST